MHTHFVEDSRKFCILDALFLGPVITSVSSAICEDGGLFHGIVLELYHSNAKCISILSSISYEVIIQPQFMLKVEHSRIISIQFQCHGVEHSNFEQTLTFNPHTI